ncbi:hypothetical protein [Bradyrhizobium sp. dw_411]|uniref:hypothetical protein n=1 Tax=Bradyrhizobium sp. dw_411 TaxID=2720082 RepID=UPI001BCC31A3|nr:hypothetical protein [Bradyrhizobium sp. dw_411]
MFKILALALLGFFATASSSLSEEGKCIPRNGTHNLQPNERFVGLFHIALNPPDFQDRVAIQRHLVFSQTWAGTILEEVPGKTGGLCSAVPITYRLPDLRVFLTVNSTARQIEREKSICTQALEGILQRSLPNDEVIGRAARMNAYFAKPLPPSGDKPESEDADTISLAALPLIYEKGSVLHALASVEWTSFGTVDAAEFRAWIRSQRSPGHPLMEAISRCVPPPGEFDVFTVAPYELPESRVLPSGQISLSRSPGGSIPTGPLRSAVIVGESVDPPDAMIWSDVKNKYCDREHTFAMTDDSSSYPAVTVRLRCSGVSLQDFEGWSIIYCDPEDCVSERVEKDVAAAVARDPEILDFARRSSVTATPRGPYLVEIK